MASCTISGPSQVAAEVSRTDANVKKISDSKMDASEDPTPPSELPSIARTMATFELLASSRDGMSVSELASSLRMNKTTVFRVLASLKTLGYVHQDERTAHYSLTFRLAGIAHRYFAAHELGDICMPILQDLADETDELVRLALAQGNELRWVAQAEGAHRRIRLSADLGEPVALHASATGKAWLATLTDEEALALVLRHGLEPRTPKTITTVEALLAQLRQIRTNGYAIALEEGDLGVLAIAVAIRPSGGSLSRGAPGTLSVAGTVLTVDQARLTSFVPSLTQAAAELSQWASAESYPLPVRNLTTGGPDHRAVQIVPTRRGAD
jgi:IclR family acetate operon transcriptional repressor